MIADQRQPTNLACEIEQARALALAIFRAGFVQSAVELFSSQKLNVPSRMEVIMAA